MNRRLKTFQSPTKVIFGIGASEEVGEEAKKLGGEKALLVTSPTPVKLGLAGKAKNLLEKEKFKVEVFDKVESEPTLELANTISNIVREKEYDIIVGVGGGSALDLAKVASIMATNPGDVKNYLGIGKVGKPGLPKILIPTTAGTGSEVTQGAVLTSKETFEKVGIISKHVWADVALVDPLMSMSMPPRLTAITGIDALSHAVEAYMSKNRSEISDALALQAILLIVKNLPIAFNEGKNLQARYNMALAALLGGIVVDPVNAGACAGHAAAYAFAAKYKVPHGVSVGITLSYVMECNVSVCLEEFKNIAQTFGEKVDALPLPQAAEKAVINVRKLVGETLGLPTRLRDVGVPSDAIESLAENMLRNTRLMNANPKEISKEEAIELFRKMW